MNGNRRDDASGLVHEFVQLSTFHYAGFVCDKNNFTRRFVVEIIINEVSVAALHANSYDEALRHAGFGDGCYRFDYSLDSSLIVGSCRISARLANLDLELASLHNCGLKEDIKTQINVQSDASRFRDSSREFIIKKRTGKVSWSAGLIITGQISFDQPCNDQATRQQRTVVVKEKGRVVLEKTVIPWQGIKTSADLAQRDAAFMLALPLSFADGVPRKLDVSVQDGTALEGSPISIYVPDLGIFSADTYAANKILSAQGMTQRFLHKLISCTVPLASGYKAWSEELQRLPLIPETASRDMIDVAVLIIGSEEEFLIKTLESLEASLAVDWVAVNVPTLEHDLIFESSDLKTAIGEIRSSLGDRFSERTPLVVISAGTTLHPSALHILGKKITANTHLDVIYADYEVSEPETAENRKYPRFLPAPDYERWIEQAYPVHLFASTFSKISDAANLELTSTYRLCNSLIDHIAPSISKSTSHFPVVLGNCRIPALSKATAHKLGEAAISHLYARGLMHCSYFPRASVQSINICRFGASKLARVSVILDNETIESVRCDGIFSLFQQTNISFEILTSDGCRMWDRFEASPLLRAHEEKLALQSSRSTAPCFANRCAGLNKLISKAKYEVIIIIDRNIELISSAWAIEALDRLQESDAGAVSPVIRYADGTVREAGMTFGSGFEPDRGLAGTSKDDSGFMDILQTGHERMSLSVSCCVFEKKSWFDCSKFDDKYFPNFFFEVDFFFRVRAKGLRLIVQPCDDVVWVGSERSLHDASSVDGLARELAQLRSRWANLMCDDPSYNPNFGLDHSYHSLAWPPRSVHWRGGDAE